MGFRTRWKNPQQFSSKIIGSQGVWAPLVHMILLMEKILRQLIGSLSILYKVLYFPSGAGFLPLTVSLLRCASSFSFFLSAFVLSGSTGLHSESTCQRCGHVSCLWVALRAFFLCGRGGGFLWLKKIGRDTISMLSFIFQIQSRL